MQSLDKRHREMSLHDTAASEAKHLLAEDKMFYSCHCPQIHRVACLQHCCEVCNTFQHNYAQVELVYTFLVLNFVDILVITWNHQVRFS